MPDRRTLLLTVLAMLAFAGNSLLCRAALKDTAIDAVSFTALRLFSGALMLAVLLHLRRRPATPARGGWRGAAALFVYAAAFSYAYVQLDAGTGALLLFGAVQVTLLLAGLLLLAFHGQLRLDGAGLAYALLSGAFASGLGYAVWYGALPGLTAIQGASVQLSVPVLAALCGALLLGEPLAPRLPPATLAVLGGIALILAPRLGRAAREGA
ncbi:TPA: EamA family transporter [Pseudomonas aeruginosa]|nr:EamA family transporter [Pseudomonas aeruginosa]